MRRSFHYFREHAAHVLGVDEEDERAVRADARLSEDARALGFELGFRGVDVGNLEADMVLPAQRVLLEEFHDRRVLAQGLDQFDLRIGRVDEADTDALRGKIECWAVRLGAEHLAIGFEALLDRRRRDADMVEAAEFHGSSLLAAHCEEQARTASRKLGDLLLDIVGAGDAQAGDHLAQLLARGDVGDADFAQLLQVEQGQALWEQLAVNDALTEPGYDAEADALRKLVHGGADALPVMRFDVLQAVAQHYPVDALADGLGPLGAAVPDQLRVEARPGDLVI